MSREANAPDIGPFGEFVPGDEADVEDRRALHRAIVMRSPDPIFLIDAESRRVTDVNPAFCGLLGYTEEAALGLTLGDIDAAPEDELIRRYTTAVQHHNDFLGERSFRTGDGDAVDVVVSTNLLFDGARRIICVFARDIGLQKRAEEERDRLQKQLWYSQKHEAVGRLAGGVAHDFNNLLTAITLGVEELLNQPELSPVAAEEADEIRSAAVRGRDLVRQLLAFSGRQILEPRTLDLNTVIRDMERLIRRTIGEDIELNTRLAPDLAVIQADPGQLEQVILNLVVNARDAMPDGGAIELGTENTTVDEAFARPFMTVEAGPHVALKVTDTGTGMEQGTVDRIFEPFFTTKPKDKGTGLGLATVYGIVKQSGGSIWAESEPGRGTTFTVLFPASGGASATELDTVSALQRRLPAGSETILLVEDDEAVRRITARILAQLGYHVVVARDGAEAVVRFEKMLHSELGPPDLVLTDVVMPNVTGQDLVRQLRELRPGTRVLYMSGYAEKRLLAGEDTGTSFIQKPFTHEELATRVRTVLD